jgi:plastocyanin
VPSSSVRRATPAAAAALALVLSACGSKPATPTEPSGPPVQSTTITITASGATPKNVQINVGDRVRFVNNDTRAHNMASDPHPEHDQCPEINVAGLLSPGQSRETGNLNTVRTCGFHDHDNPPPAGSRWTGSLVIR